MRALNSTEKTTSAADGSQTASGSAQWGPSPPENGANLCEARLSFVNNDDRGGDDEIINMMVMVMVVVEDLLRWRVCVCKFSQLLL